MFSFEIRTNQNYIFNSLGKHYVRILGNIKEGQNEQTIGHNAYEEQ